MRYNTPETGWNTERTPQLHRKTPTKNPQDTQDRFRVQSAARKRKAKGKRHLTDIRPTGEPFEGGLWLSCGTFVVVEPIGKEWEIS